MRTLVEGGEKRAHYGRLRRLQFHPVEATGDAIAGNKGEPCENLGDVRVVDSFGHLAEQRIGDGARRQQRRSRIGSSALAPIVVDLRENRRTMCMNGVGDPLVSPRSLRADSPQSSSRTVDPKDASECSSVMIRPAPPRARAS